MPRNRFSYLVPFGIIAVLCVFAVAGRISSLRASTGFFSGAQSDVGITVKAGQDNVILCIGNGTFPVVDSSLANDTTTKFWVYQYTGKEPPNNGKYYLSAAQSAADTSMVQGPPLTEMERGFIYYAFTDHDLHFRCGDGFSMIASTAAASNGQTPCKTLLDCGPIPACDPLTACQSSWQCVNGFCQVATSNAASSLASSVASSVPTSSEASTSSGDCGANPPLCGTGTIAQCVNGNWACVASESSSSSSTSSTNQCSGVISVGFSSQSLDNANDVLPIDVNDDGHPDLVVAGNGGITAYVNDGQNNFTQVWSKPVTGVLNMMADDVQQNGQPDIVAAVQSFNGDMGTTGLYVIDHATGNADEIFGNNTGQPIQISGNFGVDPANGDVVGYVGGGAVGKLSRIHFDGNQSTNATVTTISSPLSNIDIVSDKPWKGKFVTNEDLGGNNVNVASGILQIHIADIDGDGIGDAVELKSSGTKDLSIQWVSGANGSTHNLGTVLGGPSTFAGGKHAWLSFADFNGDGNLDIAVTTNISGAGETYWMENKGGGTLWTNHVIDTTGNPTGIAAGDINGDSADDIAVSGWPTRLFLQPTACFAHSSSSESFTEESSSEQSSEMSSSEASSAAASSVPSTVYTPPPWADLSIVNDQNQIVQNGVLKQDFLVTNNGPGTVSLVGVTVSSPTEYLSKTTFYTGMPNYFVIQTYGTDMQGGSCAQVSTDINCAFYNMQKGQQAHVYVTYSFKADAMCTGTITGAYSAVPSGNFYIDANTANNSVFVKPPVYCPACPNSIIDPGEQCDDGNGAANDGCSPTCQIESGWTCSGAPSICTRTQTCGDGVIENGEACDDHNTTSGDGCSSTCQVESGYACSGSPSKCLQACGQITTAVSSQTFPGTYGGFVAGTSFGGKQYAFSGQNEQVLVYDPTKNSVSATVFDTSLLADANQVGWIRTRVAVGTSKLIYLVVNEQNSTNYGGMFLMSFNPANSQINYVTGLNFEDNLYSGFWDQSNGLIYFMGLDHNYHTTYFSFDPSTGAVVAQTDPGIGTALPTELWNVDPKAVWDNQHHLAYLVGSNGGSELIYSFDPVARTVSLLLNDPINVVGSNSQEVSYDAVNNTIHIFQQTATSSPVLVYDVASKKMLFGPPTNMSTAFTTAFDGGTTATYALNTTYLDQVTLKSTGTVQKFSGCTAAQIKKLIAAGQTSFLDQFFRNLDKAVANVFGF